MRRGTIFIILFVLIAAAIVGASYLLQGQEPVEIVVAVDPLAEAWLRSAALEFNNSSATVGVGRRVRVTINVVSSMQVLDQPWASSNHPDGWIPAWSAIANNVRMVVSANTEALSLARTPLIWMRNADGDAEIAELSWDGVQQTASSTRLNVAFSAPSQSVQGFAVLLSGAAEYHDSGVLTDAQLSNAGMREWLELILDSVPSFNTISTDVAQFVAGPQGRIVDVAMGPENQWLMALGTLRSRMTPEFAYPVYPIVFDFPYITLTSTQSTAEERSASQAFAAYLLAAAQQGNLERFGLRPAQGDPAESSEAFTAAAQYGIVRQLPTVQAVQVPTGSGMSGLRQWVASNGG